MRNFIRNHLNIKWIIAGAICAVLLTVAIDIVMTGDPEIKKFLLIEVFGIVSVLVGYYWGSSNHVDESKQIPKEDEKDENII